MMMISMTFFLFLQDRRRRNKLFEGCFHPSRIRLRPVFHPLMLKYWSDFLFWMGEGDTNDRGFFTLFCLVSMSANDFIQVDV